MLAGFFGQGRASRAAAFTAAEQALTLVGLPTDRATTVDGYSNGFKMVMAEECCFDRSELSHKVNLFDLHHKYADVMHVDDIVAHLNGLALKEAV